MFELKKLIQFKNIYKKSLSPNNLRKFLLFNFKMIKNQIIRYNTVLL